MNSQIEYELRMLRVDGREPTLRDRWQAFYRLWRVCSKLESHFSHSLENALSVTLDCNPGWFRLVLTNHDRLLHNKTMPAFLRRKFIERERRKRLFPTERHLLTAQRTARKMNESGQECTPEQVAEVRCKIIREAKRIAAEKGFALPLEDDDILRMLKRKS